MRTAKTLIRLGGCPGWSESLLGAHAIMLVLSRGGSCVCIYHLVFGINIKMSNFVSCKQNFAEFVQMDPVHLYEPGHKKTCLMSYANNKGADQPAHPRSLISAFVVRCLDSVMSLVSVTKISSLMLASVAEQASLSLTWSETPEDTFSHDEAHIVLPLVYWQIVHLMPSVLPLTTTSLETQNIWAAIWQNQPSDCAPSEDSDQPGHPPSLIRVFAVRMKKAWVLSYPLSA